MELRILSGTLITNQPKGKALIRFRPHDVEGDARPVGLASLGPDRDFRREPMRVVALREIRVDSQGRARLDDTGRSEHCLEVAWDGVDELSYLIIGEPEAG
jgi:hypothetical protein